LKKQEGDPYRVAFSDFVARKPFDFDGLTKLPTSQEGLDDRRRSTENDGKRL